MKISRYFLNFLIPPDTKTVREGSHNLEPLHRILIIKHLSKSMETTTESSKSVFLSFCFGFKPSSLSSHKTKRPKTKTSAKNT